MVESLGCALLAGLGMAAICKMARLPRIVGMLAVGLPCGKLVERSDKNERKGTDEGGRRRDTAFPFKGLTFSTFCAILKRTGNCPDGAKIKAFRLSGPVAQQDRAVAS